MDTQLRYAGLGGWPMTNKDDGRLVGLGYRKRAGKDSVAKFMVEDHGFTTLAFAGPLKEAAKIIFGWTDEHVYGDLKEVVDPYWGFSPRWALQHMGTEAMRKNIDDQIWVKATMRKVKPLLDAGQKVVITDVRFPNEAQAIIDAGGELWRIDRPGLEPATHASETAMDGYEHWHQTVHNDGALSDLWNKTFTAVNNGA